MAPARNGSALTRRATNASARGSGDVIAIQAAAASSMASRAMGVRREALDVGTVDGDLSASKECVEYFTAALTGAHKQAQVGVLGICEAVDGLQRETGFGVRPAGGVIEYAAAADCGELVPVTDERDACVGVVGDGEQGSCDVLVEHAGFVHEQDVAGQEPGPGVGLCLDAGPVAVVVPAEAVLVDQPGC